MAEAKAGANKSRKEKEFERLKPTSSSGLEDFAGGKKLRRNLQYDYDKDQDPYAQEKTSHPTTPRVWFRPSKIVH